MTHTPGAWAVGELRKNGYGIFAGEIGVLVGRVKELNNARLIAAAPELLEACKQIVGCIINCHVCEATGIELGTKEDACLNCGGVGKVLNGDDIFVAFNARDAIAKAEDTQEN